MDVSQFIKPELLILVPILSLFGAQLKKTPNFPDWAIPFALEILGVLLAVLWVVVATPGGRLVETFWIGLTQGLICALMAVGAHQTYKQAKEGGGANG